MTTKHNGNSPENCDEMHDEWYERRANPRIRLMVLSTLGASLGTAAIIIGFIVNSAITRHELADQASMITRREFEATVSRIEHKVDSLEGSVTDSLSEIGEKIDRNYEQMRTIKVRP